MLDETMVNEAKVSPDEDGNCPVGYHNMPADSEHDMEWCMEGEEHEATTYNAAENEKETDKGTEMQENMLTTTEEKEAIEPERKRLALFEVTIEKDTKAMKPRTVTAKISTTSIDRDGEVLLPSGIDLKDFRKNPVVLLNHDQGGLPVGRALSVKRQSDGIIAEVQFAERPAGHPSSVEWIPDTVFNLFQQGILKAFSVGFIPLEMREPTDKDYKKFGDDVRNVISKWSLLEFSVVNVPANQDALVLQVAKNHKWLADEWKIDSGQMQEKTKRDRLQLGERVARLKLD
tara:strand:+ start:1161 stop:2024 length:864 start_codon:yes stop_codon:yes gene_type:complete